MKPESEVLSPAECCGGERVRLIAVTSGVPAGTAVTKCAHKEGCKVEFPPAPREKQDVRSGARPTRFPREE